MRLADGSWSQAEMVRRSGWLRELNNCKGATVVLKVLEYGKLSVAALRKMPYSIGHDQKTPKSAGTPTPDAV